MKLKYTLSASMISLAVIIGATSSVSASSFNDVPTSHWAYKAIDSVSDKGLMLGDMSGNFNVNDYIDKAETTKILAALIGYNEKNPTSTQQKYYEDAYNKNKSLISLYDKKFTKWDSSVNEEIAFLLEKGVLEESDLNQFVIIREDGSEALRALTREEISIFLVKAMGEESNALKSSYGTLFTDDSQITSAGKPYVYYLRNQGIVSGDGNNYFNPKNAVTRAAMAILLDSSYSKMYSEGETPSGGSTTTPTTEVKLIKGVITEYYSSLDTAKVLLSTGEEKLYAVSENSKITLDGKLITADELKKNLSISALLVDNKSLIEIDATSLDDEDDNDNETQEKPNSKDYETVKGEVENIYIKNGSKQIEIYVEEDDEEYTYDVYSDAEITQDGKNISFVSIDDGDYATLQVYNEIAYEIEIEDKNKDFSGVVIEKGYDDSENRAYYVIKVDKTNEEVTVYTNSDSYIYREDDGKVTWNGIRVGDDVDVETELDIIDEIKAYGNSDDYEGYVREIYISEEDAYLVIENRKDDDERVKFVLSPKLPRLYSLEIGTLIEVELDSSEVESIDILKEAEVETIHGEVTDIDREEIVIEEDGNTYRLVTMRYDDDTKFIDSRSGKVVDADDVDEGDTVYATYRDTDSDYVGIVTILK